MSHATAPQPMAGGFFRVQWQRKGVKLLADQVFNDSVIGV
jgi:hypothetical protein